MARAHPVPTTLGRLWPDNENSQLGLRVLSTALGCLSSPTRCGTVSPSTVLSPPLSRPQSHPGV